MIIFNIFNIYGLIKLLPNFNSILQDSKDFIYLKTFHKVRGFYSNSYSYPFDSYWYCTIRTYYKNKFCRNIYKSWQLANVREFYDILNKNKFVGFLNVLGSLMLLSRCLRTYIYCACYRFYYIFFQIQMKVVS